MKRSIRISGLVWRGWIWILWVFRKIWLLVFLKFVLARIGSELSLGKIELLGGIYLFQLVFICVKETELFPKKIC